MNPFKKSSSDNRPDLDAELQSHLQMSAADHIERGADANSASEQARRELGNIPLIQQTTRDQRPVATFFDDLSQDLRYALRTLRKNPAFTLVAIITLALGIGANTAVFSVIDSVILRPLPFKNADRLVWLNGKFALSDLADVSPPDFIDYRAANQSFDHLVAMGNDPSPSNLSGDRSQQVLVSIVTANFFETLGIAPQIGRDFTQADEQFEMPQSVILGHGIWMRAFGSNPSIVGKTIRLDGVSATVVGVLPTDLPLLSEAQIWQPAPMRNQGMQFRRGHFLKVIGLRKTNVTQAQAAADMDSISDRLGREYPDTDKGWSLRQRPLGEVLIGPVRPAMILIASAVGLLLLIACGNVANLLLARSTARRREFAVRGALGASRGRMIRQTLTESIVLAVAAGALGVFGAMWIVRLLRAIGPSSLPRLNDIQIDTTVLLFTAGISLLTGLVFGLIPALQASGRAFTDALKTGTRNTASGSQRRVGSVLVVAQVAMSLTLLVGAGLLLKSFWLLTQVDPGFQTTHVVTAEIGLNGSVYKDDAKRFRFWQEFESRAAALPGVESVGATSELPLNGEHNDNAFYIAGHTYAPSEFDDANFRQISNSYFATMRIPLLSGRGFTERDTANSAGALVVNEAFSEQFFKGQNPIGKHLRFATGPKQDMEIVGIVGDIHHDSLSVSRLPEMYTAFSQNPAGQMHIVVRATAAPTNLAAALREVVANIDKDETLSDFRTLDAIRDASIAQPRFSTQLLGTFAVLALILAAVGLYGLMAYSATQRVNEIGIRVALGATRSNILGLMLKRGSLLALYGIAIGLVASLALSRLLSTFLFGVRPTDPLTFLVVAAILATVALTASYIPAHRATQVDPNVSLRHE
ncbi:MAG TPA: ABC transporter permease [Candidatus Acidoferrum sp.]|nr:ABC transporter permease [Candidatus Acidoferrum sp.]